MRARFLRSGARFLRSGALAAICAPIPRRIGTCTAVVEQQLAKADVCLGRRFPQPHSVRVLDSHGAVPSPPLRTWVLAAAAFDSWRSVWRQAPARPGVLRRPGGAARRGPNGPDADHGPLRPLADWCCSRSCRVARTKISQPTRTLAPARRVPSHHRQPENALTVYIFMKKYMHSHSPFLIARALYALGVRPGTLGYVSACIGMSTNTQRAVGRPDGGRKCCRPPSTVRRAHSTPTKDTTHRRPSRPVAGPAGPRFDGRCCPVDAVTC